MNKPSLWPRGAIALLGNHDQAAVRPGRGDERAMVAGLQPEEPLALLRRA